MVASDDIPMEVAQHENEVLLIETKNESSMQQVASQASSIQKSL